MGWTLSTHGGDEELTAWSRIFLEQLIVAQLMEKFLSFYEIQKFIVVFTTAL
jgi:hypothetical protein